MGKGKGRNVEDHLNIIMTLERGVVDDSGGVCDDDDDNW